MREVSCALIAAVLTLTVLQPSVAGAATSSPKPVPPPNEYHPTLAQAEAVLKGRTVGPNTYTNFGKLTITGFVTSGKYTTARTSVVFVPPVMPMLTDPAPMRPGSWWNPTTWDWGHILGSTWNAVWNKCVVGAAKGVVGSGSVDIAGKLLARGGILTISPQGYLAIAIGGCFTTLVFGG